MGKGGNIKRGGSSRFSGGDSDGILNKSSKKEKLRRLTCVGDVEIVTSSKRVKLPKKFFDDCDTVNHASVPRKLRSAMNKRRYEAGSQSSPKDDKISEDEEEAMAALVAMAGMSPGDNKADEINLTNEASSPQEKDDSKMTLDGPGCKEVVAIVSKTEDSIQESIKKGSKEVTNANKLRKRCLSHVYICHLIKDGQLVEGTNVNSHKEPKDVKTDTNPENIVDDDADKGPNEGKTHFEEQRNNACGMAPAPYFGSLVYDPSQWSRPMWVNPGGEYQKWANGSKMQLGHRSSSGYEQNGGLFLVESSPTLGLSLQ